jgi:hypothetical protein
MRLLSHLACEHEMKQAGTAMAMHWRNRTAWMLLFSSNDAKAAAAATATKTQLLFPMHLIRRLDKYMTLIWMRAATNHTCTMDRSGYMYAGKSNEKRSVPLTGCATS